MRDLRSLCEELLSFLERPRRPPKELVREARGTLDELAQEPLTTLPDPWYDV